MSCWESSKHATIGPRGVWYGVSWALGVVGRGCYPINIFGWGSIFDPPFTPAMPGVVGGGRWKNVMLGIVEARHL